MEAALISEGEEIDLERLRFDELHVGRVADPDRGEIRLLRFRAERGEFLAVEFDDVFLIWEFIVEDLQDVR